MASRAAAALRRQRACRQRRERQATRLPPAPADVAAAWQAVQAVLDQELARLPEKYRAPLVLCYLDGHTRDEAARLLGLNPGVLHGRLQRGRDLLRDRLACRGLAPTAALLAVAPAGARTRAAVPATLVLSTARAAGLAAEVAPVAVLTLAQEVLTGMFLTKLKTGVALSAVALVALLGGAVVTAGGPAGPALRAGTAAPSVC